MGSRPQSLQKRRLRVAVHACRVYHILPSGQGAAQQAVSLLHQVPAVNFQLPAGHPVSRSCGEPLRFQELLLVQFTVFHKSHHVQRGQVAEAVAVQQDLAAGIAAVKIRPALPSGFLVHPSGFS